MTRTGLVTAMAVLLIAACGNDQGPASTTEPADPGESVARGEAFVESVEFLFLESYPVQVRAIVTGNVPTPCHQPAWEVGDVEGGRVEVTVYSTYNPDRVCAQVLEPFEATLPVGSFETGGYVLELNGVEYPFTI